MKKVTKFLVPLLLGLLIIASIFWYLFIYDRDFTRDTLIGQARFQDMHGNSRMSAWFYDAAYSFSDHDEAVAIELANQYKADKNYTKAELTLTTAINDNPSAELYAALSKTFVEQDKLLDAVNMLDNISDPAIKAELDTQRPTAPAADFGAGYYSQYMDIHLSSTGSVIYYSDDGTYPSTAGLSYGDSISLPAGETTIYALAVDEDGLVSPLSVLGYTITGVIEPVTFTDPVMEAAIRELIGADADEVVYTNELWGVTEFTVPDGVTDYVDLTMLPYLLRLTIQNKEINTLSHLSSLTSLQNLDLSGSSFPVEDLSVLAGLPYLTNLNLSNCSLSTIAGLVGAPCLMTLNLGNNTIRNLDVLVPMTTLTELDLQHNAVTSLSDLGGLVNLEKLDISYNAVTDLSPLSGCVKLSWLDAGNNSIASLSAVNNLPLLTYLSVEYNDLTDVSILSSCTKLTELSIASNDITDISALSTLTKLQIFDFSANEIAELPAWPDGCALQTIDGSYNVLTSIDGLKNMQSLSHVYMDYNLITNIDALADCYCLVQINVFGNTIEDVSNLREHDIIVNYDPTV